MDDKQLSYLKERINDEDYNTILPMPYECQIAFVKNKLSQNEFNYVKKMNVKKERFKSWFQKNMEYVQEKERMKQRVLSDVPLDRPVRKYIKHFKKPIEFIDRRVIITFD